LQAAASECLSYMHVIHVDCSYYTCVGKSSERGTDTETTEEPDEAKVVGRRSSADRIAATST